MPKKFPGPVGKCKFLLIIVEQILNDAALEDPVLVSYLNCFDLTGFDQPVSGLLADTEHFLHFRDRYYIRIFGKHWIIERKDIKLHVTASLSYKHIELCYKRKKGVSNVRLFSACDLAFDIMKGLINKSDYNAQYCLSYLTHRVHNAGLIWR